MSSTLLVEPGTFTVNRKSLLEAFGTLAKAVPKNSPRAILFNVSLRVNGDTLSFHATNLETGVVTSFESEDAGVADGVELLIPFAKAYQILKEIKEDETVDLAATDSGVRIGWSSGYTELNTEGEGASFPERPDLNTTKTLSIKAHVLKDALASVAIAAAGENSRYALCSVAISVDEADSVAVIATDGKRLSQFKANAEVFDSLDWIPLMSKPFVTLVQAALSGVDDDTLVDVTLTKETSIAAVGSTTIYGRLVEGRFPRYQDVFPKDEGVTVDLPVGKLASVLRQARITTGEESRGVDFGFAGGVLTLTSSEQNRGSSKVTMPIEYDGEDFSITYDPVLILDWLKTVEDDATVQFETHGKGGTVVKYGECKTLVVMPLTRERRQG